MIDNSTILIFDGTIITGLFIFYAFLVALAQRFETAGNEAYISSPIRYLACVQFVFVASAILALIGFSEWALVLSVIGLLLLAVFSLMMILEKGIIQVKRSLGYHPSITRLLTGRQITRRVTRTFSHKPFM
jgi:hypothetical protein